MKITRLQKIDDELYEKLVDEVLSNENLRICQNCLDHVSCDCASYGHLCPSFDWEDYKLRYEVFKLYFYKLQNGKNLIYKNL